jgi:hypothetical protein
MKLNIQNAVNNQVEPRAPKSDEPVAIFERYVASTLAKLDKSISDAFGRYKMEGKAYTSPKPSENWKVISKEGTPREDEVVKVWLKVGIIKVVIGERKQKDGSSTEATSLPVKNAAENLIPVLEEMKASIEAIAANRDSEEAQDFWKIAIKSAFPKAPPKDGGEWDYDPTSDTYIVKK